MENLFPRGKRLCPEQCQNRTPGCRAKCPTGLEEDRLRLEMKDKIKKAEMENDYFEARARKRTAARLKGAKK